MSVYGNWLPPPIPPLDENSEALAAARGYRASHGDTPEGPRAWLSWPHLTWTGPEPFDRALAEPQLLWPDTVAGGLAATLTWPDVPDSNLLEDLHRAAAEHIRGKYPDRDRLPNADTHAMLAFGLEQIKTAPDRTKQSRLQLRAALYPLLNETVLAIRTGEPFGPKWDRWADDEVPPPSSPAAVARALDALRQPETWLSYGRGLDPTVAFVLDVRALWESLSRGCTPSSARRVFDQICDGYPVPEPIARSVRYAIEALAPEVHASMLDACVWSARRLALTEWIAGPDRPRPRGGTWASRNLFSTETEGIQKTTIDDGDANDDLDISTAAATLVDASKRLDLIQDELVPRHGPPDWGGPEGGSWLAVARALEALYVQLGIESDSWPYKAGGDRIHPDALAKNVRAREARDR